MPAITLFTKEASFYLESPAMALPNLRIDNGHTQRFFEEETPNRYKIAARDVADLLVQGQESRVVLYYGEENTAISSKEFTIYLHESLVLPIEEQPIYFYISLDQKLRFMWQQVPSTRAYYLSSQAEFLSNTDESSHLKITIETKHLALNGITIFLTDRQTKEQIPFHLPVNHAIETGPATFSNTFFFDFDETFFMQPFVQQLDPYGYQLVIFDFSVRLSSAIFPLTKKGFRLAATNKTESEHSLSFNHETMGFFRFYPTINGNFSARFTLLPYDAGNRYLDYAARPLADTLQAKPIILIFEYPHKAQDNGLAFFRYLMTKQDTFDTYYVIEKNAPDVANLTPYLDRVIFYKSAEHVHMFFAASYLISSHTPNYGIPLLTKKTEEKRSHMHKIFLQHGITALKNVEPFYGNRSNPGLIDTVIVSSQREKTLVESEMFYPVEAIKNTGLPRFDDLLEGANSWNTYRTRKKILIMPSWRKGQDTLSDEDFQQTIYYQTFQQLLTHPTLQKWIQEKGIHVSFYLHNNFQKYRHLFYGTGIQIIDSTSTTVQQLLKTHGILITDYSSVGLDFALQKRAVIYYQFDEEVPEIWQNTATSDFLPGPICITEAVVLSELTRKLSWNYLDKKYRKKLRENLYTALDTHACQRVYQELIKIEKTRSTFR